MNEPGHCRQLIFWRLSSHAAIDHDDSREKLEPKHRPSDRRACLFVGRFRKHAGVIGFNPHEPGAEEFGDGARPMALVELPVLFRRGSVRRPGIAETLGSAKRNLPTHNMRPPDHVAKHGQQADVAPEPCRSIPGNRSLKLACGTRDAWCGSSRSGTSTNEARAAGRPVAPNIFRVSASHREKNLPVAPARSGWAKNSPGALDKADSFREVAHFFGIDHARSRGTRARQARSGTQHL